MLRGEFLFSRYPKSLGSMYDPGPGVTTQVKQVFSHALGKGLKFELEGKFGQRGQDLNFIQSLIETVSRFDSYLPMPKFNRQ